MYVVGAQMNAHRDSSFEHPHHIFGAEIRKIIQIFTFFYVYLEP